MRTHNLTWIINHYKEYPSDMGIRGLASSVSGELMAQSQFLDDEYFSSILEDIKSIPERGDSFHCGYVLAIEDVLLGTIAEIKKKKLFVIGLTGPLMPEVMNSFEQLMPGKWKTLWTLLKETGMDETSSVDMLNELLSLGWLDAKFICGHHQVIRLSVYGQLSVNQLLQVDIHKLWKLHKEIMTEANENDRQPNETGQKKCIAFLVLVRNYCKRRYFGNIDDYEDAIVMFRAIKSLLWDQHRYLFKKDIPL